MIKVDFSVVVFFYIFFTAILILLVWSFVDFGTKLKTYGSDEKYIWHCPICANTYIDSRHDDISRCPRCGSYNEKLSNEEIIKRTRTDRGANDK